MKNIVLTLCLGLLTLGATAQETLTLEKAVAIALKNGYNITISRLESDIAARNNSLEAVGAYPTLTGTAQYNFGQELISSPYQTSNGGNASLDASWTLFNGFKIKIGKRIAEMKYDLSKGGEAVQIENAIVDVTLAYYSYILQKELYATYEVIYKLSKDRFERDKTAYEIGSKDSYSMIQSESAYLADKQTLLTQQRSVRSALYTLNAAMAMDGNTQWLISEKITVPKSNYELAGLTRMMFSDNESLKNQYINQKIVEENEELARNDWFPKLDLRAGLRYNGSYQSAGSESQSSNSLQPYAGATLTATIYGNGVKKRNTFIARMQSKIMQVSIDQMRLSLSTRLMTEYDGYTYNSEILTLAERDLTVSKINMELSLEKLNDGSISWFDYRSVQVTYQRAALSTLQSTYNVLKNNLELTRLTGGIVK